MIQVLKSIKIEDKKLLIPNQELRFAYQFYLNTILLMNKVSVINFGLHKKYVIENEKDYTQEQCFKSTNKRRTKSPEQTIKNLIKKGRLHYVNPYVAAKSGKSFHGEKENNLFRHSQEALNGMASMNAVNRFQTSNSTFVCSRGHKTNFNSNIRLSTEDKQNCRGNSRHARGKNCEGDQDEFQPSGSFMFREFRNISEQSLSRVKVENERRYLKMTQIHKSKYDGLWNKHMLPSMSKQKATAKSLGKFQKGA